MGSASKKIRFPCNECVEKGWDSREVIPALQLPALGLVLNVIPAAARSISLLTKHHFLLLPLFPALILWKGKSPTGWVSEYHGFLQPGAGECQLSELV